jgi:hypothetical protein
LWNAHSQVIYWWTATEVDEERAYLTIDIPKSYLTLFVRQLDSNMRRRLDARPDFRWLRFLCIVGIRGAAGSLAKENTGE